MPIFPGTLSNLEMSWLLKPEFFPHRAEALAFKKTICIGTKSRNLGDALSLTPLAEQLKKKFPDLKIYTFARAFNPVVFYENPAIERVQYFPKEIFGDDCNWGEGQLIQQKQRFFDLPLCGETETRPKIYLNLKEEEWAKNFLSSIFSSSEKKPLCILHPSGITWRGILPSIFWESLITKWRDAFNFLQLGLENDTPLKGAATLFFQKRSFWDARKLFAIMPHARAFIGVDSGPMHAASAFSVPSFILVVGEDPKIIFKNLQEYPYFLKKNRKFCTLYKQNYHFRADGTELSSVQIACSEYLKKQIET